MPNKELITKIVNDMKALARLQKTGLESTENFPYYNLATAQLVKLKILMMRETPAANHVLLRILDNFLEGGGDLSSELPEMIDKKQLSEAEEIHQRIIDSATELKINLQGENQSAAEQRPGLS